MVDISGGVGIRELKEAAPDLVRRAAAGERVVITRYGKPAALLVPFEATAADSSPSMRQWHREKNAFERMARRALAKHHGRYVAVRGGRIVGSDVDPDRLSKRMWRALRGGVFFVARVGAPAPVVEMTGFDSPVSPAAVD